MVTSAVANKVRALRAAKARKAEAEAEIATLTRWLVSRLTEPVLIDSMPAQVVKGSDTVYDLDVLKANLTSAQYGKCIKVSQNLAGIRALVKAGTISATLEASAVSHNDRASYVK